LPPNRRVTSQDVARLAGVSRTTVSLVLNNVSGPQISADTRQRVVQAAQDLGYVPDAAAQALASRRSQIIGIILVRSPQQVASDAFLNHMLAGLIDTVQKRGMRLLIDIVAQEHQEQAYLELVRAKRIDGLILAGPSFDDRALVALEQQSFPTVLIGELPGVGFASVDVDNRAAAHMAAAHLISLGHTRIACITNAQPSYAAAVERLRGYQEALYSAGLDFDPRLVRYGDFDPASGYKAMHSLLSDTPRPSAVFVASDTVALGALAAIREAHLQVPEDISLVGYDDIPFALYTHPPLTTIHLPAADLGRKAGELLFRLIRHETPDAWHVRLNTYLVVRQSCGALPGS
jgi:LacI family transcriptional regulator